MSPVGGPREFLPGGRGEAISTLCEGRKEGSTSSLLPSENGETATILDVLVELGVLVLSPGKRGELAGKLEHAGVGPDQVRLLGRYVQTFCRHDPARAAGTIVNRLQLPIEELRVVFLDLERSRRSWAPEERLPFGEHDHGSTIRAAWRPSPDPVLVARGLIKDGWRREDAMSAAGLGPHQGVEIEMGVQRHG